MYVALATRTPGPAMARLLKKAAIFKTSNEKAGKRDAYLIKINDAKKKKLMLKVNGGSRLCLGHRA